MLKTFISKDGKTTVAVIEGSKYDAVKKVAKKLHLGDVICEGSSISFSNIEGSELPKLLRLDMLIMSDRYVGKVICNDKDELNDEVGRAEAIRKVKQHYSSSMNRAILHWQKAMMKKIETANLETFKEITRWFR